MPMEEEAVVGRSHEELIDGILFPSDHQTKNLNHFLPLCVFINGRPDALDNFWQNDQSIDLIGNTRLLHFILVVDRCEAGKETEQRR